MAGCVDNQVLRPAFDWRLRQVAREDCENEHAPEETKKEQRPMLDSRRIFRMSVLSKTGRCIMAKKASKLNPEASVCKYVAKYGLAAHLFYNPDGSVVAVKLSKLDSEQHADDETSEDLRKLL